MLPIEERVAGIITKYTDLKHCEIDPDKIVEELKREYDFQGFFSVQKIEDLLKVRSALRKNVEKMQEDKFNLENQVAVEQIQREGLQGAARRAEMAYKLSVTEKRRIQSACDNQVKLSQEIINSLQRELEQHQKEFDKMEHDLSLLREKLKEKQTLLCEQKRDTEKWKEKLSCLQNTLEKVNQAKEKLISDIGEAKKEFWSLEKNYCCKLTETQDTTLEEKNVKFQINLLKDCIRDLKTKVEKKQELVKEQETKLCGMKKELCELCTKETKFSKEIEKLSKALAERERNATLIELKLGQKKGPGKEQQCLNNKRNDNANTSSSSSSSANKKNGRKRSCKK